MPLGNDTLATALTNVRDHIDESAAALWTDNEVNRAIVRAHRDLWARILGLRKEFFLSATPATITLVSGTMLYSLPADFYRMKRIKTTSSGQEQIVWVAKDRSEPSFVEGQRTDITINLPSEIYYDIDLQNIAISPIPRAALTASGDYYTLPTDPTGSVGFGVLDPFVPYIEMLAASRLLAKGPAGDPSYWKEEAEAFWRTTIMPVIGEPRQDQTPETVESMFDQPSND